MKDNASHKSPANDNAGTDNNWTVWRQGDDGNRFVMEEGLTEEAARQMVAEFEARGHKQLYWAARKQ
ncbi:hypothetical protein [uncultured Gimesia sp.]|uniref:hypothetical protein n=1 Tax=uncultured Gimesia sp. TaxID=1678688 RepID=UPI0030DB051B|tara:strand:+ start:11790 stop:11990 length:201 start_codon:yes stop_codon:yes gene_type:complete